MTGPDRRRLFDTWAKSYDAANDTRGTRFPFLGYDDVLEDVVRRAARSPIASLADVGIGTGNLAKRAVALMPGLRVYGLDNSDEMLSRARESVPGAVLLRCDLARDPLPRLEAAVDVSVSTYTLHEFSDSRKLELVQAATAREFCSSGTFIVGDISFEDRAHLEAGRRVFAGTWDGSEHYFCADEFVRTLNDAGLRAYYEQLSPCAGVFVIRREREDRDAHVADRR